jgi:hypothetical protein
VPRRTHLDYHAGKNKKRPKKYHRGRGEARRWHAVVHRLTGVLFTPVGGMKP